MPRKIDAHHHFWKVERGDYHWMPDNGPLRHDYLPADQIPLLQAAGIDGTILIQAAQTTAETNFLLDLAMQPGSKVLGVTGWVPLDLDSAPAELDRLAAHPKVVAIRPMLHDLKHSDWITQAQVIQHLQRFPALGLCFEVLSYPMHLPSVLQAIDQVPELDVVIDHLSKPVYGSALQKEWQYWMEELARRPRVHCKLSGMVTEVGEGWNIDDFRASADFVLDAFGPERVMFGSDWPVCLKVSSFMQVIELAETLTSHCSETEHAQIWGETAARFYHL
jgi:L-fuconolactonase